jgi:hypothetical protein
MAQKAHKIGAKISLSTLIESETRPKKEVKLQLVYVDAAPCRNSLGKKATTSTYLLSR